MGRREMYRYGVPWCGKLKERTTWKKLVLDGRIILKWVLKG
jgi:hypothetical protein